VAVGDGDGVAAGARLGVADAAGTAEEPRGSGALAEPLPLHPASTSIAAA
jgi:hypothetical protein